MCAAIFTERGKSKELHVIFLNKQDTSGYRKTSQHTHTHTLGQSGLVRISFHKPFNCQCLLLTVITCHKFKGSTKSKAIFEYQHTTFDENCLFQKKLLELDEKMLEKLLTTSMTMPNHDNRF